MTFLNDIILSNNRPNKMPVNRHPANFYAKGPLKVALMEPRAKIRKYWASLINSFPGFVCNCACETGEEALQAVPQARPDVVLMDTNLPGISGIECTTQLKRMLPKIRIVMFTSTDNHEIVVSALTAGADGYLLKPIQPAGLRAALLEVLQNGAPMTSLISRCVVESFRRKRDLADDSKHLSLKEEWILTLLCKGYTNGLIADRMGLSIYAICFLLRKMFKKFGVRSRTQAATYYLRLRYPRDYSRARATYPRLALALSGRRTTSYSSL